MKTKSRYYIYKSNIPNWWVIERTLKGEKILAIFYYRKYAKVFLKFLKDDIIDKDSYYLWET